MVDFYQQILIPLDGSKLAEKALPYAQDLAAKFDCKIILLNVRLPAEDPYHPALEQYLEKMANTLKRDIHNQKTEKNRHVEIDPVTVNTSDLVRHAAEDIINYAAREKVDLIAMASHGHSGIKHWALGGVSDKLLHISNIPVLLVRANTDEHNGFDKILVPLDGSELAECVLPHAQVIGIGYNCSRVTFLRVVESLLHSAQGESDGGGNVYTEKEVQEIEYRNEDVAKKYIRQVAEKVGFKRSIIHTEVLSGNVAETIIKYAENNDIDLIIMSTHGYSGMSRWTLGSISERVLRYSGLPVLLIRGEECTI